jgi:hypothetical protein
MIIKTLECLFCLSLFFGMILQGLAYVDFSDNEHLEAAIKKNKHKLLGKKVSVARSDPSRGKKSQEGGPFSKGSQGMLFEYLTNRRTFMFNNL